MDTRILEINTLENKIKNISSGIDFHCMSLGNYIVINEPDGQSVLIKKSNLSSEIQNIKNIFYIFDEAVKKKELLGNNKKLISDIEQKIKETSRKTGDLEKENYKHYIGIAETLYELYKLDNQKMSEFEPYFFELIKIDNKNKEINEKIKEIETDKSSSFFGNLKDIGEKTILNTKKKYNYSLMLSHFKTAGEKICIDKIYEKSDNSDIEALFVSYKNNLKIAEELSQKIETLKEEKENLKAENEVIMQEFNFDPNSFVNEIKVRKDAELTGFGKKIFDVVGESENDSEISAFLTGSGREINRLIDEIKTLSNEKQELEKKLEQVRLTIEIDKTEKNINGLFFLIR
jgi:hypothetical protein